jgi:site-specific DNA recombinase
MERLLTAYQEELLSLDELRRRMPELRRREQSLQAELEALRTQAADQGTYLRLAQTLSTFLGSLRANVATLDVLDRQRIARLLLKEVVVGHAHIIIRAFDSERYWIVWWQSRWVLSSAIRGWCYVG